MKQLPMALLFAKDICETMALFAKDICENI